MKKELNNLTEEAVICYRELDKNSIQIINIFDSPSHAEKYGFGNVLKIMKGKTMSSFLWVFLKERKEEWKDLLENFQEELSYIIKADENNEVIEIYKGVWEIPKIKINSLAKQLQSDKKTLYYGANWYYLVDYLREFPNKLRNINLTKNKIDTLNIVLTVTGKLISVNDLYKTRVIYAHGRPRATIYKNPAAIKLEGELRNQLLAVDFTNFKEWIRNTKKFSVTFNYILKSGVTRRDLDNLSKMSCDCLVSHFRGDLGINTFDDAQFTEIHMYKSINPSAKHEYICVQLKESGHNVRFDVIPEPENIFIYNSQESNLIDLENFNIYREQEDIWNNHRRDYEEDVTDTKIMTLSSKEEIINYLPKIIKITKETMEDDSNFCWFLIKKELEDEVKELIESISQLASKCSRVTFEFLEDFREFKIKKERE